MNDRFISAIKQRRTKVAGLLLSEKALNKKDVLALNLELYAASQAINSAQRYLLSEYIMSAKEAIKKKKHAEAMKLLASLERLVQKINT